MKNTRRALALILVLAMGLSVLAGCGSEAAESAAPVVSSAEASTVASVEEATEVSYEDVSTEVYNNALGEFYATYEVAKSAENLSERFALMAVAEAKLLESGVMLPTSTQGGMYAISRVAPNTVDFALWGSDYDRFHQALVVTEPITSEDRAEMKAKYAEIKGTGTYEQWAEEFLLEKGYTLKDDYTIAYNADPQTWDVLATSLAVDSEAIVNTYDGLYEYDCEGIQQPALATSYDVSEDGLTYTFHLREGVMWVDSQGREVAPVVADDFVAGMQHMMDACGGLEYLVEGIILNASQYISGEVTDFNEVGVKAVDDHTLEYTLEAPCSYFMTLLGYSIFAPMSRSYYTSQGGGFGAEYDPAAETYTYGLSPNNIAYCGPYLVTNATAESTIVFKANESYWNADNINVKTLTWLFNDGSDATKAYNDMKAGTIDGCSLNSSALEVAKADGWFDQYNYVSATNAVSYMVFLNLNRAAFANVNDASTAVSAQTPEQAANTNIAMNNAHFRRALCMAVDRGAYNAQVVGEDLKLTSLRNTYTPGNFVYLEEDVTIDINGTATTFPAGTAYGAVMQAQIDADGIAITVWDPNGDDGIGSSDGFDGWYNVEAAQAELEAAIAELAAEGLEISAENPIYVDLPYPSNDENYTNKANALKQSVDAALGGAVIVNLVSCVSFDEWYYTGYFVDYGYEMNYDIFDLSGWGPDYGDPSTYLDTFLPDYAGYMTKCLGIF